MSKKKLAILRTDASVELGNGHIIRCLALADALASGDWLCLFAVGPETLTVFPAIQDTDHSVLLVECDEEEEPGFIQKSLEQPCALLVVDHYQRDARFEAACRTWAGGIAVIDDLSDRRHECDVLLDQNQLRAEEVYRSLIPSEAIVLAGPDYAMLRQQFFSLKYEALKKFNQADQVKNIFVSFGSTDLQNFSSVALQVISEISSSITIDVSIGSRAPNLKSLQSLGRELSNDVKIHVDHVDMVGLMMKADIAVGAAGLTAWERCCIGLPSIAVITAENQQHLAIELHNHGAATVIEGQSSDTRGALLSAAKSLIKEPKKRINMSVRAGLLCDGLGAGRVAQAITSIVTPNVNNVCLRPAGIKDAGIMYEWQSSPGMRQYFRNPEIPTWQKHVSWLSEKLNDPECIFSIILYKQKPAGLVRLDLADSSEKIHFEVSLLVSQDKKRLGIGKAALLCARQMAPNSIFHAEISPDNKASDALFKSLGYLPENDQYRTSFPKQ